MIEGRLDQIREYLLTKLGLHYSKKREQELYVKLNKASNDFNFRDPDKFIDWLLKQQLNDAQTKLLAKSLTIGETYFFREKKALDYIQQVHLPELIRQRKGKNQKLRIWSAGCATGEEPYTLGILLQQTVPDIINWDIRILATDINPTFLTKAKKGVYSQWSFRKLDESFKTSYFTKLDQNNYQIIDPIKRMVKFSHLNLASDNYPSPQNHTTNFDIILCRNVLIYFSPEGAKTVSNKFYKALNINGMLAVSPVETSNLLSSVFTPVSYKGNTIFKKDPLKKLESKKQIKKKISTKYIKLNSDPPVVPIEKSCKNKHSVLGEINREISTETNKIKTSLEKDYNYNTALEYFVSGKFDEAENHLLELNTKQAKDKSKVYLLLAKVYAQKNQLPESEKWCKKNLAIDKINVESYFLLSTIYQEQERTEEAIQALNNIIFLDPDFVLAHFSLGNIFMKLDQIQIGLKHFENVKKCLVKFGDEDIIDGSDGLSAGNLNSIINSITVVNQSIEVF